MAVTGSIFKSLRFDNEDSRDYGVYITGSATYNAPARDVQMITIPARNGAFALDNGRFENIEVSYPAGIFADTETDFAQAISDFRNALCSKVGYFRLEDDYNPDEYRMAIYKSGLEVNADNLKSGEFTIVFECKPQRWLASGESEVTVRRGYAINNPTRFASAPLLKVDGSGELTMAGETINITNALIGELPVSDPTTNATATLGIEMLNTGDAVYPKDDSLPSATVRLFLTGSGSMRVHFYPSDVTVGDHGANYADVTIKFPKITYNKSGSYLKLSSSLFYVEITDGETVTDQRVDVSLSANYYKAVADGRYKVELSCELSNLPASVSYANTSYYNPVYYGNSTKSASNPIYIDFDIGEAYGLFDGQTVNLNNVVALPAELPKIAPSGTIINWENTITSVKMVPRWWKV